MKPESGRPGRLVRDSDNTDRAAAAKLERAATTTDFSRLRAHEGANGHQWDAPPMAKTSSTNQIVFDDGHQKFEEMTEDFVRKKAEQFVLDLIAGKLFR